MSGKRGDRSLDEIQNAFEEELLALDDHTLVVETRNAAATAASVRDLITATLRRHNYAPTGEIAQASPSRPGRSLRRGSTRLAPPPAVRERPQIRAVFGVPDPEPDSERDDGAKPSSKSPRRK
jgi:hypothetical protein